MSSRTDLVRLADVRDEVLGLLEVDPLLGTQFHAELTLLLAGVYLTVVDA